MNRPDVTITLRAEHLSWKAGFSDGDILDVFYETGDYHPEPESRHDVLVDVVRAYLIPDIEQALGRRLWPDYPIAGCHNPIRVSDDDRYQDWPESVKNLEVVVDRDMFEQCRQGVLNRPEYLKADTAWTDDSPKKAKSSHQHHLSHVAALVAVGLIVDLFAGGGGASTGIEAGMGRQVDEAANHDPSAIAMHEINHPLTGHHQADIRELDPQKVCNGRPVDVLWASPDCKHFSKAKGGKPVDKNIRSLADVVVDWAEAVEIQQGIVLENVEEFEDWGPLIETHKGLMPCPDRKGEDFRRWVRQIRNAGATSVEWRTLRACDYGAPTIRKRLFLIARFDGQPIVWPAPTHGHRDSWEVKAGILLPFKTAADCIDWSIPCQSVINRPVPLKDATNRRIAAGLVKFVLTAAKPFIVPITHTTNGNQAHSIDDPLRTITTAKGGEFALVEPTLEKTADIAAFLDSQYGQSRGVAANEPVPTVMANGGGKQAVVTASLEPADRLASYIVPLTHQGSNRGVDMNDPAPTITGANRGELALIEAKLESATKVAAFMAQHNSGFYEGAGRSVAEPLSAITMRATQQQLVTANLVKLRGTGNRHGQSVTDPMHTLTAGGQHMGLVYAFLVKYYGAASDGQKLDDPMHTVTGLARFGLVTVTVDGEEYVVTDIAMRMLTPRELARAQGFPDSYVLDPVCWYRTDSGKMKHGRLPKTHQIARIGNSVCPIMAEVLTRANFARPKPQPLELERMAA